MHARIPFALLAIVLLQSSGNLPLVAAERSSLAGLRPNIVLVMTDDQGKGELSCLGHPVLKTPHLDQFHAESVRFVDFHVSPTCAPTRSAIMTGRHEFKNGVTHTIHERERLTLDATTIAQVLQRQGYGTGIFGKWHLGDEPAYQPQRRGFEEVFIHGAGGIGQAYPGSCADAPPNAPSRSPQKERASYFSPVIKHNGTFVQTDRYCTDAFFDQAMGWIRAQAEAEQPFFAYIVTNTPHSPRISKEKDQQPFLDAGWDQQTAASWGMIRNIDENVGRLMKYLKAQGLEENTLVIFMTDNGQAHRQGSLNGKKQKLHMAGMRGGKGTPYEGGTRVPAFWRWPGKLAAGHDLTALTAHIDIFPTLAELVGDSTTYDQVEGRSLLPLLAATAKGTSSATWDDRFLFTHLGRWQPGEDPETYKHRACAVRGPRFRLVNNSQLYDIQNDPGETTNVIQAHPELVARMRKAFDQWWETTKPLMVNESAKPAASKPYHTEYRQQLQSGGIPAWSPPAL